MISYLIIAAIVFIILHITGEFSGNSKLKSYTTKLVASLLWPVLFFHVAVVMAGRGK